MCSSSYPVSLLDLASNSSPSLVVLSFGFFQATLNIYTWDRTRDICCRPRNSRCVYNVRILVVKPLLLEASLFQSTTFCQQPYYFENETDMVRPHRCRAKGTNFPYPVLTVVRIGVLYTSTWLQKSHDLQAG